MTVSYWTGLLLALLASPAILATTTDLSPPSHELLSIISDYIPDNSRDLADFALTSKSCHAALHDRLRIHELVLRPIFDDANFATNLKIIIEECRTDAKRLFALSNSISDVNIDLLVHRLCSIKGQHAEVVSDFLSFAFTECGERLQKQMLLNTVPVCSPEESTDGIDLFTAMMTVVMGQHHRQSRHLFSNMPDSEAVFFSRRLYQLLPQHDTFVESVLRFLIDDCGQVMPARYLFGILLYNNQYRVLDQPSIRRLFELIAPHFQAEIPAELADAVALAPDAELTNHDWMSLPLWARLSRGRVSLSVAVWKTHRNVIRGRPDLLSALFQCGIAFDLRSALKLPGLSDVELARMAPYLLYMGYPPQVNLLPAFVRGEYGLLEELFHEPGFRLALEATEPEILFLFCAASYMGGNLDLFDDFMSIPELQHHVRRYVTMPSKKLAKRLRPHAPLIDPLINVIQSDTDDLHIPTPDWFHLETLLDVIRSWSYTPLMQNKDSGPHEHKGRLIRTRRGLYGPLLLDDVTRTAGSSSSGTLRRIRSVPSLRLPLKSYFKRCLGFKRHH